MARVDVVWLIDADPPSAVGGNRGFYPSLPGAPPPDHSLMAARLEAILATVEERARGQAAITVHTSPQFRDTFFEEPYVSFWHRFLDSGCGLALHPHEDLPDGSSLYGDLGHLTRIVADCTTRGRKLGIGFSAFRSGTFAFNPHLGFLLEENGILVDLSALPGKEGCGSDLVWPPSCARAGYLPADFSGTGSPATTRVLEVPIGWDGEACDLNRNYLFNERTDLEGLRQVWARILAEADRSGAPCAVNFLCHGFGLAEPRWRDQAIRFLDHMLAHGGHLVSVSEIAKGWPPREPTAMDYPLIAKERIFPDEEYETRLASVRNTMRQRSIDVLLLSGPENIFYLSGYQTFGFHNYQLLVISGEREPFLILRFMESMLAAHYSWIPEVVTWDDTDDPVAVTVAALRSRGLLGEAVGVEERGYFFRVATWKKLNAAIPRLVDGSGVVERSRATKSAREIAYMREAAKLTDIGMKAAVEEARASATDNDIAAAAYDAMTRAGAEYLTRDPIVTSGSRAGIPHTCYARRRIKDGDSILLEFSGVYNRYYSPLMRGVAVGRVDPEVEKLAEVCIEGLEAAIAAVRPGATAGEVDAAARNIVVRAGYWENYRKRAGYSVGIGFSSWVEGEIASLKENDPTVLQPGMCFHLPIALRLYGRAGLGFSETVHVTDSGAEVLGSFPHQLFRR